MVNKRRGKRVVIGYFSDWRTRQLLDRFLEE